MRGQLWLTVVDPSVHSVPPPAAYLWIPIAVGGGLAFLLVLLTGLIGMPYVDQGVAQTGGLFNPRFWTTRCSPLT